MLTLQLAWFALFICAGPAAGFRVGLHLTFLMHMRCMIQLVAHVDWVLLMTTSALAKTQRPGTQHFCTAVMCIAGGAGCGQTSQHDARGCICFPPGNPRVCAATRGHTAQVTV